MNKIDSQAIELIGQNIFISMLIKAGLEVAKPYRDRGVDLIIYEERKQRKFMSIPIQLKISSKKSFSINKRYSKTKHLITVYLWNIFSTEGPTILALNYAEAILIGKKMGWTNERSWIDKGNYVSTNANEKLVTLLEPHFFLDNKIMQLFNKYAV
jgi:hypothetical protein